MTAGIRGLSHTRRALREDLRRNVESRGSDLRREVDADLDECVGDQ